MTSKILKIIYIHVNTIILIMNKIQIRDYIINELNSKAYLQYNTPENELIKYGIIVSHNEYRLKRIEDKLDSLINIMQIDDNKRFNNIKEVYILPIEFEIKKKNIVPYEHQITIEKITNHIANDKKLKLLMNSILN
jgi:hypothetical protein